MANIDERYKRGKIYTIRCRYDDDSLVYVGSTIQPLAKRIGLHRRHKKCSLYKTVDGDWDNWYIELYEDFPCDNKEQLEKREGEVIREIATINKRIAGRDDKQYYQNHRDEILEKHKEKYQKNRDVILEKQKEKYQKNRDDILEKHKQYRKDNCEKIAEKAKEKCKCDICGAEITKVYLKTHQKSAKCMSANK